MRCHRQDSPQNHHRGVRASQALEKWWGGRFPRDRPKGALSTLLPRLGSGPWTSNTGHCMPGARATPRPHSKHALVALYPPLCLPVHVLQTSGPPSSPSRVTQSLASIDFSFSSLFSFFFKKTLSVGHAGVVAVGCDVLALHYSDDSATTARSGLIDHIIWENFLNSKRANKLRQRKYVF